MDKVGPEFLGQIGMLLLVAILACVLWDFRHEIRKLFTALARRFIHVRSYDDLLSSVADEEREEKAASLPVLAGSERTTVAGSMAFTSHGTERTPAFGFALSEPEIAAVQKMTIYLYSLARQGRAPSKSGAILAGFGLKRGGGAQYARASLIYDTLFGPPEPAVQYPDRTPEQEATRKYLEQPR